MNRNTDRWEAIALEGCRCEFICNLYLVVVDEELFLNFFPLLLLFFFSSIVVDNLTLENANRFEY